MTAADPRDGLPSLPKEAAAYCVGSNAELETGDLLFTADQMRAYAEQCIAHARPEAVDAWQTMDSAPRDGSLFLCWVSAERWSQIDGGGSGLGVDTSDFDFGQWRADDQHPDGGYFINMMGQIGDAQDITRWQPLVQPTLAPERAP